MQDATKPDWAEQFAAAFAWWREAGVDLAFADEPRAWLASAPPQDQASSSGAPAVRTEKTARSAPTPPASIATPLPDDLAAFQEWWMSAPELDSEHRTGRVLPRGMAGADLMVLVACPEDGDRDRLLSGPEGRLLDAFLGACGIDQDRVYRASVLPCHSPGADWSQAAMQTPAQALLRHVKLVRPARVLVVGLHILPLIGHDPAQGPAVSTIFNHEGVSVPMLAVRRFPAAASQPRWKSALWRAWLDWTG